MTRTTAEITVDFGVRFAEPVTVPAGTRVAAVPAYPMQTHPEFFVDEFGFIGSALLRSDAAIYGIRLTGEQVYGAPTHRQYDDPAEQWAEWKRQAARLPLAEIRRHASVSRDNRHSCRECFCCAAAEVLSEATL